MWSEQSATPSYRCSTVQAHHGSYTGKPQRTDLEAIKAMHRHNCTWRVMARYEAQFSYCVTIDVTDDSATFS